jgi:hypothetical protein
MVGIGLGVSEGVAAGVAVGRTGVGVDGGGVRTGVAVLVGDGVAVCGGFGVAECRARGCNCGRPSTQPRALGAAAEENANSIVVMPKSRANKPKNPFISLPLKRSEADAFLHRSAARVASRVPPRLAEAASCERGMLRYETSETAATGKSRRRPPALVGR